MILDLQYPRRLWIYSTRTDYGCISPGKFLDSHLKRDQFSWYGSPIESVHKKNSIRNPTTFIFSTNQATKHISRLAWLLLLWRYSWNDTCVHSSAHAVVMLKGRHCVERGSWLLRRNPRPRMDRKKEFLNRHGTSTVDDQLKRYHVRNTSTSSTHTYRKHHESFYYLALRSRQEWLYHRTVVPKAWDAHPGEGRVKGKKKGGWTDRKDEKQSKEECSCVWFFLGVGGGPRGVSWEARRQ